MTNPLLSPQISHRISEGAKVLDLGCDNGELLFHIQKSRHIHGYGVELNPENVKTVVRELSPYGVDVSSGVEKRPGLKDPKLVKRFIQNAKEK